MCRAADAGAARSSMALAPCNPSSCRSPLLDLTEDLLALRSEEHALELLDQWHQTFNLVHRQFRVAV
jgi:hypothetical protein